MGIKAGRIGNPAFNRSGSGGSLMLILAVVLIPLYISNMGEIDNIDSEVEKPKKRQVASFNKSHKPKKVKTRKQRKRYRVKSGFTRNSLAMVIHLGESRNRGFNDYNRGSLRCRGSNRKNVNLTSMKMSSIYHYQSLGKCDKKKLFAVGMWQVIPVTMKSAKRAIGIKSSDRFDRRTQNRIFVEFLASKKRPAISSYIKTGKEIKEAGLHVALEWASMQSPLARKFYKTKCNKSKTKCRRVVSVNCRVGRGCHDGNGSNMAHTGYRTVLRALKQARSTYVNLTNQGYSDKQAYALALGVRNLEY